METIVPDEFAGIRFDQALSRLFPEYSRSRLQHWLKEGRVLLDGESAESKQKVWGGEQVLLDPLLQQQDTSIQPENIPLRIVFEDEDLLVVNKPAGFVVHPGNGNPCGTLMNALLFYLPSLARVPRAGIVHRLDKDTSGLLVVAKTLQAQTHLVRQMQARTVARHYLALAHGETMSAGTVDAPIGRHPALRTRMAVVESGRPARTHYTRLAHTDCVSLIRCSLETGRTHQIRVHMASIGHPLVGDPVYGRRQSGSNLLDRFPRQALHAFRLGLLHPSTNVEMRWEAPLEQDFAELLAGLGERFGHG